MNRIYFPGTKVKKNKCLCNTYHHVIEEDVAYTRKSKQNPMKNATLGNTYPYSYPLARILHILLFFPMK